MITMGHPYDDFAKRIIRNGEVVKFVNGLTAILEGKDHGLELPLSEFAHRLVREGTYTTFCMMLGAMSV
jgi:hypothetical protein